RRHTRCLSDWSSDVCSSDLRDTFGKLRNRMREADSSSRSAGTQKVEHAVEHVSFDDIDGSSSNPDVLLSPAHNIDLESRSARIQIGRASCRERVEKSGVSAA